MKDEFGDRMKMYESTYTSDFVGIDQILCVRIDGKGFSKFTKFCEKPFDQKLTNVMVSVTKKLVEETHAKIGYTQSDEITLIYTPGEKATEYMFGGKVSKLNSILASMTTAFFNKFIKEEFPELDKFAFFDCRSWGVPNRAEASNVLLWRAQDCKRNSVSSMFRYTLGHVKGMNRSTKEKVDMMMNEGYDWDLIPSCFRFGTYVLPVSRKVSIEDDVYAKIPEDKKPESLFFDRNVIETFSFDYDAFDFNERYSYLV